MKKLIEIDEFVLKKLKIISALEDMSVKALMEKAIELFVRRKEQEGFDSMTKEEKEDFGLLALMQQVDKNDKVSEEDFFKALNE